MAAFKKSSLKWVPASCAAIVACNGLHMHIATAQYYPAFPTATIDTITQPTQTYVNLIQSGLPYGDDETGEEASADDIDDEIGQAASADDIAAFLTVTPRDEYMPNIKASYIESLKQLNVENAATIERFLDGFDIEKAYADFALENGFEPNNVGHTLAAFNLIGWLVANQKYGEAEEGKYAEYFPAMRAAYSRALYQHADDLSIGEFQRMNAQMKFSIVLLGNFTADIYRTGDPETIAKHARSVNDFWILNFGFDMTELKITESGLVPT